VEDWIVERVITSQHYNQFSILDKRLFEYYVIVLYDTDGTSVGNIRSPLRKTYMRMKSAGLDPKVLLGGLEALKCPPYSMMLERPMTIPFAVTTQPTVTSSLESVDTDLSSEDSFTPDLETVPCPAAGDETRRFITWMPSMIIEQRLYLGRIDQASDPTVIHALGITHVVSTTKIRGTKFKGLVYILVNKTSFSNSTLRLTSQFITDALESGGNVLVHGCDGIDQSAAVVLAALMRHFSATLEDCLWYLTNSRPGVNLTSSVVRMVASLEEEMFGRQLTETDSLWQCYEDETLV